MLDKSKGKPCWHPSCPSSVIYPRGFSTIQLQLSVELITHCKYVKQLATAITVNWRDRFAKRHFFTFLAKKKLEIHKLYRRRPTWFDSIMQPLNFLVFAFSQCKVKLRERCFSRYQDCRSSRKCLPKAEFLSQHGGSVCPLSSGRPFLPVIIERIPYISLGNSTRIVSYNVHYHLFD